MDDLRPRSVLHVDLAAGLPAAGLTDEQAPALLVGWDGGLLLGYEQVHRGLPHAELAARVATLVTPSVGARLVGGGVGQPRGACGPGPAPLVGGGCATPWAASDPGPAPVIGAVEGLTAPLRRLGAVADGARAADT